MKQYQAATKLLFVAIRSSSLIPSSSLFFNSTTPRTIYSHTLCKNCKFLFGIVWSFLIMPPNVFGAIKIFKWWNAFRRWIWMDFTWILLELFVFTRVLFIREKPINWNFDVLYFTSECNHDGHSTNYHQQIIRHSLYPSGLTFIVQRDYQFLDKDEWWASPQQNMIRGSKF